MWSSGTVRNVPPEARTAARICRARGGRGIAMPSASVGEGGVAGAAGGRSSRPAWKAAASGETASAWTAIRRGRVSIRPSACSSAVARAAPSSRVPLPTGTASASGSSTAELLPELVHVRLRAVQEVRVEDVRGVEDPRFVRRRAGRQRGRLPAAGDGHQVRAVGPDLLGLLGRRALGDVHRAREPGPRAVRGDGRARVARAVRHHPVRAQPPGQLHQQHRTAVLEGQRRHQVVELGRDGVRERDERGAALAQGDRRGGERQEFLVTPQ